MPLHNAQDLEPDPEDFSGVEAADGLVRTLGDQPTSLGVLAESGILRVRRPKWH